MSRWLRALALAPSTFFVLGTGLVASVWVVHPAPLFLSAFGLAVYAVALVQAPGLRASVRRNLKDQLEAATDAPNVRAESLAGLTASQKEHFAALEALKARILSNYAKMPGGRVLAASSESRLEALLRAFLKMVGALNHHRASLNSVERAALKKELAELEVDVAAENDLKLREVKARHVDLLQKRLLRFEQAFESRELLSHQLAAIEDVLRLTLEQSVSLAAPEAVAQQVDDLAAEVAATEETMRELEKFVALEDELPSAAARGSRVRS